jgi:hypothetical protein
MKKIWKCPNCPQISTRHSNLIRHIQRKHKSIGEANLAYISGNSTFNLPASTTPPHSHLVQYQNAAFKKKWKDDIFYAFTSQTRNNYDRDYWLDRCFRLQELGLKLNQTLNMNPVRYFPQPQPPTQLYGAFTRSPTYITFEEIPGYQNNNRLTRKSDSSIGFKIGICENCFTILTMEIAPNTEDRKIQDFHTCDPHILAAIKRLDPIQYCLDFLTKVNNFPDFLFQKCKDWASNTTGMLYLIARRFEPVGEYEKVPIPENYKEIPWLNKVLVESKIKLNDTELYEFLRFVKNGTTKLFTFNGRGAKENLVYKIGVSTVPITSE